MPITQTPPPSTKAPPSKTRKAKPSVPKRLKNNTPVIVLTHSRWHPEQRSPGKVLCFVPAGKDAEALLKKCKFAFPRGILACSSADRYIIITDDQRVLLPRRAHVLEKK